MYTLKFFDTAEEFEQKKSMFLARWMHGMTCREMTLRRFKVGIKKPVLREGDLRSQEKSKG